MVRQAVDPEIDALVEKIVDESLDGEDWRDGTLNYIITRLVHELYKIRYKDINAAIGVLECAKQEYYRKIASPYENEKCEINGEV
jgi:hypothetical protein